MRDPRISGRRILNRLSLARFVCALLIATFFAGQADVEYQLPLLRVYMIIAATLTVVMAILRRERPFTPFLNRWDEALGFYGIAVLIDIHAAWTAA